MIASVAAEIEFCDFQDTTLDLIAEGTSVVKAADTTVSDLTYSLQMPTASNTVCSNLVHSFNTLPFVTVAADFTFITIDQDVE